MASHLSGYDRSPSNSVHVEFFDELEPNRFGRHVFQFRPFFLVVERLESGERRKFFYVVWELGGGKVGFEMMTLCVTWRGKRLTVDDVVSFPAWRGEARRHAEKRV